jgi:two-component system catabolic regulation response regulator CreB
MRSPRETILVIEDEAPIAETILYALKTDGFDAAWKTTGGEALEFLRCNAISLVVLDVGLPDTTGFDLCRELRRWSNVPVIFLTARSEEIDRIVGLEIGADDYMAKPFSPRELSARVRAVLRRGGDRGGAVPPLAADQAAPPINHAGAVWSHDSVRCRIAYRGRALELTRNEYRLLEALLAHPGRVYSREQLMQAAWDDPGAALDRTVDAHVKLVRAKLREISPDADPIVTHRGLGYSLREET